MKRIKHSLLVSALAVGLAATVPLAPLAAQTTGDATTQTTTDDRDDDGGFDMGWLGLLGLLGLMGLKRNKDHVHVDTTTTRRP